MSTLHSVIRVLPHTENHITTLNQLSDYIDNLYSEQVDFWKHPSRPKRHVDIRVPPSTKHHVIEYLNEAGMAHDVITHDVQELIRHERSTWNPQADEPRIVVPRSFDVEQYHTFDEILEWLNHISSHCGSDCTVVSLGETYHGRPLKLIRIGTERPRKPAIWIDAGIHAREWIAPATAIYLINKLINSSESDPEVTYLRRKYTWYILPIANPDGYVHTWEHNRMWRKNRAPDRSSGCRGVDLNRNWDFHWGGRGTSSNPCSENFRGRHPFSELESLAMANFIWSNRDKISMYLSLHSYGQLWLTPWGFSYKLPKDYDDMISMSELASHALRSVNGSEYEFGSSARMLYLAAGGSDDWAKGVAKIKYSYTIELADTGNYGFVLPPSYIKPVGTDMFHAFKSVSLGVLKERRRIRRKRMDGHR